MAAYCRVYDSRHLQADCQELGSAPEPYTRQLSMGYLLYCYRYCCNTLLGNSVRQIVHTDCASVYQAAKLAAALLKVARVTVGLVESNGSQELGSAPEPYTRQLSMGYLLYCYRY